MRSKKIFMIVPSGLEMSMSCSLGSALMIKIGSDILLGEVNHMADKVPGFSFSSY